MTPLLSRAVLATCLAFLSLQLGARAEEPATKTAITIPDIPYTKFVLKNGLTVLVHEDHKTPVVAVNTWYHVGSKNEKPGKTGFAHLFEHLMFSGSDNFDKTYINALERIGATSLNGTTNKDRTNYFQNVPTSMLDYALFAESDRMGHLLEGRAGSVAVVFGERSELKVHSPGEPLQRRRGNPSSGGRGSGHAEANSRPQAAAGERQLTARLLRYG